MVDNKELVCVVNFGCSFASMKTGWQALIGKLSIGFIEFGELFT